MVENHTKLPDTRAVNENVHTSHRGTRAGGAYGRCQLRVMK